MVLGQWLWVLTASVVGIATYYYFYWKKVLSYWSSRNVSGPTPIPVFGNVLSSFLKPKPFVEMDWYKKYGKIFGVFVGDKPALTVADPELIKQILVKDFHSYRNRRDNGSTDAVFSKIMFSAKADDWKRIRAIASPTFTSGKIKKMYALINMCCTDFLQNLDEFTEKNNAVELKQLMGSYTMDVIARCAFASKTNTYSDPNNDFTTKAYNIFHVPLWKVIVSTFSPRLIFKLPILRRLISSGNSAMFFVEFTRSLMKHRKTNNEKHNDFLQLLMDVERSDDEMREESNANEAHHVIEGKDELKAESEALSNVLEKKLTESEILAQCFLFFIAGYETTATTLSYCTYELAMHPNIQQRLFEETRQAFNEKGEIDYEVLSKLPFLDSVISETLRLYPPVIRLERVAMEDMQLGDTGIQVDKGVVVEIPVYAVHHDPEYYPEPDVYNPDRFMPENRDNIKPYTYIPFGAGPRNCIGMRFALLEAKLALAKISQKYKFSRVAATDVPVIYNRGRFLLQAKRLVVGIEKRKGL